MKVVSAGVFVASVAVTLASPTQRADPNAIGKCTTAVHDIIAKAATNPKAKSCSTDAGVKSLATVATTGLKADDAKKILATASCKSWFTEISTTVKAKKSACDFTDPKTGTAEKRSTSNTAKFNWSFQDFLHNAHKVKTADSKQKTTAKPSTTKAGTPKAKPASGATGSTITAKPTTTKPTTAASVSVHLRVADESLL
ncbi:hypothetical protein AeMF1_001325 [Aphanomyces euteiches]|nr:hypothetical protein AeMF1_001325 [Aphanomyces euteiches]KAH9188732.1 hypothetical protein AeNC1_009296 [Aphanomyces euteiches]